MKIICNICHTPQELDFDNSTNVLCVKCAHNFKDGGWSKQMETEKGGWKVDPRTLVNDMKKEIRIKDMANKPMSQLTEEEIQFLKKHDPDTIHCPKCETLNSLDARFCKSCGNKMAKEETIIVLKCNKCGKEYDSSFSFCDGDGEKLKEREVTQEILPNKSTPTNIKEKKVLKGIGGWLILVAFGLVMSPILNIILLNIGFIEVGILPIGILIFEIYLLFPFFQKEAVFTEAFIGYLAVNVLISLIFVYTQIDSGGIILQIQLNLLYRAIITAAIWITYILRSKRVKNTFVN